MSDFFGVRTIKARKRHVCAQCCKFINVGEDYDYSVGVYEGDFYANHEHPDCRALWIKIWDVRGLGNGDTQDFLIDDGDLSEDKAWIEAEFPAVAARLWSLHKTTQKADA